MKYCLVILSLMLVAFSGFAGKVVFLHGTGCAGKTSLCKEILEQGAEWKVVCEDDIFYKQAALRWKSMFSEEFEVIEKVIASENILHAVMRNQILFCSNVPQLERLNAKKAIRVIQETLDNMPREWEDPNGWSNTLRRQITQTILDLAHSHHVIVDTWFLKEKHIEQISKEHEVVHVVAYCSLLDVIKRTIKRNYDTLIGGKNISNLRFFHQTIKSFTGLYDLSEDSRNSIDSLDKGSVMHALDVARLYLQYSPDLIGVKNFTCREFTLKEFEEYREDLISKFRSEKAYVIPKFKIDAVVRTDQRSSIGCAKDIIEMIS